MSRLQMRFGPIIFAIFPASIGLPRVILRDLFKLAVDFELVRRNMLN